MRLGVWECETTRLVVAVSKLVIFILCCLAPITYSIHGNESAAIWSTVAAVFLAHLFWPQRKEKGK